MTSWVRRLLAASIVTGALAGPVHAQTSESVEYYATDAVGSVRVVFDASGNILGRMDYGPFGGELFGGANLPDQRFAGLFRDGEAGLDYAQARSYQVRTGRFNAPDPVYSALYQPQKWNRYSYAINNPLTFVDPSGLDPCRWVVTQGADGKIKSHLDCTMAWWASTLLSLQNLAVAVLDNLSPVAVVGAPGDDGIETSYREPGLVAGAIAIGVAVAVGNGKAVARRVAGGTDDVAGSAISRIRNSHLAGRTHPKTGIPFTSEGFPDFSGVSKVTVKIQQTGNRSADFAAANKAAGFAEQPRGFTWHHHEDGVTMQLVPTSVHRATGHTGGVAVIRNCPPGGC